MLSWVALDALISNHPNLLLFLSRAAPGTFKKILEVNSWATGEENAVAKQGEKHDAKVTGTEKPSSLRTWAFPLLGPLQMQELLLGSWLRMDNQRQMYTRTEGFHPSLMLHCFCTCQRRGKSEWGCWLWGFLPHHPCHGRGSLCCAAPVFSRNCLKFLHRGDLISIWVAATQETANQQD